MSSSASILVTRRLPATVEQSLTRDHGAVVSRDVKNILRLATDGAEMAFGALRAPQEVGVVKLNTIDASFPLGGLRLHQPRVDALRLDDPILGVYPTGSLIAKPPVKLDTRPNPTP